MSSPVSSTVKSESSPTITITSEQLLQMELRIDQLTRQLNQADIKNQQFKLAARGAEANLKPPKPSKFDGIERHYATSWLDTMTRFFDASGVADDEVRLTQAVAYLEKDAAIWWTSVLRSHPGIITWSQFRTVFKLNYQPIDSQRVAAQRIRGLRQIKSVRDYITLFRREALLVDPAMFPPAALQDMFLSNLKPEIQAPMLAADLTKSSLEETMAKAQAIDGALWSAKQRTTRILFSGDNGSAGNSSGNGSAINGGGYRAGYRGGQNAGNTRNNPIELGAVDDVDDNTDAINAVTMPWPTKLTDAEREQCRKENRCFKCRQLGHMSTKCTVQFTPKKW
jgi:hypothetical protein